LSDFSNGVSGYIVGEATVKVHFPVDIKGNPAVNCCQCPFYRQNYRRCGLNDEMVAFGEKYIGQHCPLTFTGEVKED
jgi:hypothetical protein